MFYDVPVTPPDEPRRPKVAYLEQPCKSALNPVRGMAFRWSLNPYTGCEHRCAFCYVRAYEKRADRPFGTGYGRAVRVKTNIAQVLRSELARPSWRRELVAVGAATDPYQPAEGRYRLTRSCLKAFVEFLTPVNLITRGPMIVRDVDVLTDLSRRAGLTVSLSIPTLDAEIWRRTEPGTAPPSQRLRAVRRLAEAGIQVTVAMAPILPGLSDRPEQLEAVVRSAQEAGATGIWAGVLHLRDGTRQHFLETLARYWPHLLPSYLQEYRERAYLPAERTLPIHREVARVASRLGMPGRHDHDPPSLPRQLSFL
jgi:DNA repair photolyase